MNLDELQSIRDRERQSDSLQQLRETFYADVGEFVGQLREEREAAAARADDPFDAPEVNRLTDDINTAEQTVEAIYERRVGKLVKMASFAAADMPTDDEGLTAEERELFEQLVASIEQNREQVFGILDGEDATPADAETTASTPTAETPTDGVDAADLMGGSGESGSEERVPPETPDQPEALDSSEESPSAPDSSRDSTTESETPTAIPPDDPPTDASQPAGLSDAGSTESPSGVSETTSDASTDETEAIERETVRITQDVGEIFGVDEREYDLSAEDVVTLPATNVGPLIKRDAAERLD